jgi:hypothetical protein
MPNSQADTDPSRLRDHHRSRFVPHHPYCPHLDGGQGCQCPLIEKVVEMVEERFCYGPLPAGIVRVDTNNNEALVELLAEALHQAWVCDMRADHDCLEPPAWGECSASWQEYQRDMARAVLAALRDAH